MYVIGGTSKYASHINGAVVNVRSHGDKICKFNVCYGLLWRGSVWKYGVVYQVIGIDAAYTKKLRVPNLIWTKNLGGSVKRKFKQKKISPP